MMPFFFSKNSEQKRNDLDGASREKKINANLKIATEIDLVESAAYIVTKNGQLIMKKRQVNGV